MAASRHNPTGWTVGGIALIALALVVLLLEAIVVLDGSAPPQQEAAQGSFHTLVFSDEFSSLDSIDLTGTGSAKDSTQWFTDRPFGWGTTDPAALSVRDGVLTIDEPPGPPGTGRSPNYSISTSSPTGAGTGYQYGYFEARIAFDPRTASKSVGWPAFWGLSRAQIGGAGLSRVGEIDFFEAYHEPGKKFENIYAATVHEVQPGPPERSVASFGNNTVILDDVDWNDFHTYGCRWEPANCRGISTAD